MRATLERVVKLEPHGRFALPELPGEPLEPRLFTSPTTARRRGASAAAAACFGGGSRRGSRAGSSSCRRDGARGELEAPGGPAGPPASSRRCSRCVSATGASSQSRHVAPAGSESAPSRASTARGRGAGLRRHPRGRPRGRRRSSAAGWRFAEASPPGH